MRVAGLRCFSLLLPTFLLATFAAAATPTSVFNIRDYGATGNGKTLDTQSFARAVEACTEAGGGTVYVPPGNYLTGTIQLKSRVTLQIEAGATLLGSEDPDDYPATENVWGDKPETIAPLIYAVDAQTVTITGRGTIDGQGKIWWKRLELANPSVKRGWPEPGTPEEKAEVAKLARDRPRLIRFLRCSDVLIEHVNLRNSPNWTVHPLLCEYVRVDGVSIFGDEGSHNTDGINPESCRNVHIVNCRIDTGDDCITLKSGLDEFGRRIGRPTENVTISNCVMHRGHGGVTIGSEMSGGIRNVAITNCIFQGTDNGIRIKSQRGRGGVVEGITASNIVMEDVPTPFIITMFYAGTDKPNEMQPVGPGTPRYRDFHFSDITARGAGIAGAITGLQEMPIENISFSHVQIAAEKGFIVTNATGISFLDTTITVQKGSPLILRNSHDIDATRLHTRILPADTGLIDDDSVHGH